RMRSEKPTTARTRSAATSKRRARASTRCLSRTWTAVATRSLPSGRRTLGGQEPFENAEAGRTEPGLARAYKRGPGQSGGPPRGGRRRNQAPVLRAPWTASCVPRSGPRRPAGQPLPRQARLPRGIAIAWGGPRRQRVVERRTGRGAPQRVGRIAARRASARRGAGGMPFPEGPTLAVRSRSDWPESRKGPTSRVAMQSRARTPRRRERRATARRFSSGAYGGVDGGPGDLEGAGRRYAQIEPLVWARIP